MKLKYNNISLCLTPVISSDQWARVSQSDL